MALSPQIQNQITELMQLSEEALDLQNRIQSAIARYNQNGLYEAVGNQDDLNAINDFKHLTQSEIGNCVNAITAVDTALGDYTSGQAVNLLKMKG